MDNFTITITPNTTLKTGDTATINITAAANTPYQKTISATFKLVVAHEEFSYNIADSVGSTYLILNISNTLPTPQTITLTFNPAVVTLDMTNDAYIKRISSTVTTINSHSYVNSITFKVDALSSTAIRFYKTDISKNYTYPNGNSSPIVTVQNVGG